LIRAEVHKHGVVFHAEYYAEPVFVVCHLIACRERLGRGRRGRGVERAARQAAPGRGAGCLHSYHHAPPAPAGVVGEAPVTIGRTHHDLGAGNVDGALHSVGRSQQGAPVVHRSVSVLVSTDVAAAKDAATYVPEDHLYDSSAH